MKKITLTIFTLIATFYVNAQDTCATAVAVTAGTTTVGAIDGTELADPICAANDIGHTATEWYVYTPTISGVVNINSEGNILPNSDDTRVHIYTGTCGALVCHAGNDDIDGANFLSNIDFPVESGTTYYIAWDNRWNSAGFDFVLTETVIDCSINGALPYLNEFDDNIEFSACFVTEDADGDGISWISQQDLDLDGDGTVETFATNGNSNAGQKDDWLFSHGLDLVSGTEYTVTVTYNTFGANGNLAGYMSDDSSSTATHVQLFSDADVVPQGDFATLESAAYQNVVSFTPSTTGTYYLSLNSFGPALGGFILVFDIAVEQVLSIEDNTKNNISIYPNPTTDFVNVNITNGISLDTIEVYSITGQKVLTTTNTQLDVSNLSAGVYVMKVNTAEGQYIQQIIKE